MLLCFGQDSGFVAKMKISKIYGMRDPAFTDEVVEKNSSWISGLGGSVITHMHLNFRNIVYIYIERTFI